MSAEAKLQLKLKKKLRTAVRNSDTVREENAVSNGHSSSKDDKVFRRERTSRKEMKSNTGGVDRKYKPPSPDRRKKRIYAGHNSYTEERRQDDTEALEKKSSSKRVQKRQVEGGNKSTRTMWLSGRGDDVKDSFRKLNKMGKTVEFSSLKLKTEKKDAGKKDCSGVNLFKKHSKCKFDTSKHFNQLHEKQMVPSSPKATRKKGLEMKSVDDDLKLKDDQPKKRKRIRIDPYDTSNKRLDDYISIDENTKESKPEAVKNVEMSKNAQFRAIQPSPSILSFVEDNLLGRRRMIELRRAGYNVDLSSPLDNVPLSTSSEREKIEETVFRNKLSFFAAAKVSSSFPNPDLPEIAFAGRSNVGKSSLLNALTRQWGVVRTSDKPGLTQTINFFKLGSKLCLVDLPGYGFAYAKEEVKDAWEELVKEYVSSRIGLRRVCLLIDTKWGMKPRDHELIDLMERSQTKCQIVLTKTDLVFPIDVARRAMQIEESLRANKSVIQPVMMVSSKSGAGIRTLRSVLAKIVRFAKV